MEDQGVVEIERDAHVVAGDSKVKRMNKVFKECRRTAGFKSKQGGRGSERGFGAFEIAAAGKSSRPILLILSDDLQASLRHEAAAAAGREPAFLVVA